ncbi:MAG: SWIM zinc finger family protein [Chloroflexi bacterium]|nr:SWIM zinc finger family protein [Chloroflexota bacterium]
MSLTFANFKQVIPTQILTRGREYLRQGQILDLSFDEEELIWEAQVEGTDLYDVRIELVPNGSLNANCTCPYELGDQCKHVAAVLYAIEDAFPDQLGTRPRKKPAKRQTRHDKLRQRLEKTSREQLISILLELTQSDRELLNQLLIHLDPGDSKPMDYRRVVKDALRAGRGEYGFLDYTGSNRAGRKLGELLHQAEQWRAAGDFDRAIGVYQAVIDETVPTMAHADDSSGILGDCIGLALESLAESVAAQGGHERENLLTYCLERARRKEFHNWDWGWDLLAIAEKLVSTPPQRTLFTSALDGLQAEISKPSDGGFISDYGLEQVALFRLALIDRFDGPEAARKFLSAHVHLDRVRMELIDRCIKAGELEEAMRQIQTGIASSNQRHVWGLTNQYQALRVKLLQQTGDKTGVIEGARALWLDRGAEEDFELLHSMVPSAEWLAFVEELVKATRRPEQLAWLYARENRWDDLLTLVKTDRQGDWLIDPYRAQLESRFPAEVAELYEKVVGGILVSATGRGGYRQAVAYLHQMKKIGQAARAEALAGRIRTQYANRPALLDELNKLR